MHVSRNNKETTTINKVSKKLKLRFIATISRTHSFLFPELFFNKSGAPIAGATAVQTQI